MSLYFLRSDFAYYSHTGWPSVLWFAFVGNELYYVISCMFSPTLVQAAKFVAHWVGPCRFIHLDWVSVSHYSSCSLAVGMVCRWFHCDCLFFGVYAIKIVVPMCVIIFSVASTWNILGEFSKVITWLILLVLDLVLYLFVMVISTLVSIFGVLSTSGITWGFTYGVFTFIFPIFIFGKISFFLV